MKIELKLMTSLDLLKPCRDSLSKECDHNSKRETLGTFGILGFVNTNVQKKCFFGKLTNNIVFNRKNC
jgi:hypothetical protein